jgi:hypothetical protein
MDIKNLDRNILYRVCEELTRREECGPLDTRFIYRTFSDIPDEKIAENIQLLVSRGWLEEDRQQSTIYLTDRGQSEIRSFIPDPLLKTCEKPKRCRKS